MEGVRFELEENSRCTTVVLHGASIMRHRVLMCTEGVRARCDVGGRHDVQEVLVRDEVFVGRLKGIVERLNDVGEMGTEREFGDDV